MELRYFLIFVPTPLGFGGDRPGRDHLSPLYVIKFVSDLRQVRGFLRVLRVSSTNKTDCHDITEILLKVALHTISLPPPHTHKAGTKNVLPPKPSGVGTKIRKYLNSIFT
jgi:hypothetical protein